MEFSDHGIASTEARCMPAAKHIPGVEVAKILRLLTELREVTLSRSSHSSASQLIRDLGGSSWTAAVIAIDRGQQQFRS